MSRRRTLDHGTGGAPEPSGELEPPGTLEAPPVADRHRTPRWVAAALAGALVVGAAAGSAVTLLVTGGEDADATATTAAAGPTGETGSVSTITVPQSGVTDPDAYGTVEVTGALLPRLGTGGDTSIGMTAPEVRGADFDGNEVAITNDGSAKLIVFLAHWCPYCAQEAPVVRDWYATGGIPESVDVYTVSTLTDFTRSNYPPRAWFEEQDWNVPLIADDTFDSAAEAFGLSAVPFWVMINADGTVAARFAGGGVPADTLTQIVTQLAAGA